MSPIINLRTNTQDVGIPLLHNEFEGRAIEHSSSIE